MAFKNLSGGIALAILRDDQRITFKLAYRLSGFDR
jgi:hypothetical protein